MRELAIRSLKRMYRTEEGLFAFRLSGKPDGIDIEGLSHRYTATVLIGLAGESEEVASDILAGRSRSEVCDRLLDDVGATADLGQVALTLWAARALNHGKAVKALDRLRSMQPDRAGYPTVELAWSLTALVVEADAVADEQLAEPIARRLLASFDDRSGLFPHWPNDVCGSRFRRHVTCFADMVYPIQALSHYYRATGSGEALEAASRCCRRMCELQGPQGQWWWHYDVRTGRVVERFPVYSVHQDSMAPMAIFALDEAAGADHTASVVKSLQWLIDPPELAGSLIDDQAGVIWRKVARREPGKLVRGLQAAASGIHPAIRVPGTDLVFRPGSIDYESRPYHMGWILYAWPEDRIRGVSGE